MAKDPSLRARTLRRRAAWILILLCGGALAVEGLVRLRQWKRYGTFGPIYSFALHEPSGLEIPVPDTVTETIRIDSRGFRGDEIEVPKPEGRVRIAFLGGSTTYCAEASSNAATWPEIVGRGLQGEFPQADIDFVNGGVGGYSTEQSLLNWEYRVAPLDPDLIVIYHATNDITVDTRPMAVEAGIALPEEVGSSWLSRNSLAWGLVRKNLLLKKRMQEPASEKLDVDPGEASEGFRKRLTDLVRACKEKEGVADVALVTFATRVRPEQDAAQRLAACNTSIFYNPYLAPQDFLDLFAEYNRVIREVAANEEAVLIEGENLIPSDAEHFRDSVHFTDAGNEMQAQRVLEQLTASPQVRALLER